MVLACVMAWDGVARAEVELEVVRGHQGAVIDADHPASRGNRYGYEGGTAVKVGEGYHLFLSEM